jgi:membrane protease YdiL (CAAX protease family)
MGEPFRSILRVLMVVVLVIIILWIIWQLLAASGLISSRPFRFGGEPDREVAAVSASPARHLQGWG